MRGQVSKSTAIAAMHLVCTGLMAQQAVLTKANLEVRDGKTVVSEAATGSQIQWSANGKFFFVSDPTSGALQTFTARGVTRGKFKNAQNPRWSLDGTSLLIQTPKGLAIADCDATGSQKMVSADAKSASASFSSDATRIAFGTSTGLSICDLSDMKARAIAKGHPAVATTWSGESDVIAFIDNKGYLLIVRPNGTGLHQIAKLDATEIEWSPNGRWVLAKTADGWQAIQPADHHSEPVACDTTAKPTWTGGQKLMVVQAGIPRKLYLGAHDRDESGAKIADDVRFFAQRPQIELSNDSLVQGSFRNASRPSPGDMRLTGYVDTADALAGRYILRVESSMDAAGRERVYAQAQTQPVDFLEGARQTDGRHARNMQPGDMREDDRVTIIVHGNRVDPQASMALREAWIEGEAISTGFEGGESVPSINGAPHLSNPSIEYDGITRDKIVVPMVFPVAGKVWWEDWFLASRGGGKRRHHGQDLMAKKMTPLVACFDGTVRLGRSGGTSGFSISLDGDNGYRAFYCHLNNDTPGTDDDRGGDDTAFAPGLVSGLHVKAGQFIAYVGNSGNAKTTDPHCHFEIKDKATGAIINPAPSLRAAIKLTTPGILDLPTTDTSPRSRYMEAAYRKGSSRRGRIGRETMAYWPLVQRFGEQYHLAPELIAAVIEAESSGNPQCVSSAGAMGLMQLMPDNCHEYGVGDPYSPEENIRGGVAQLADHLKRFGGDIEKALAAYNAGPGHVLDGSWRNIRETRNYVPKVLGLFESIKGQPYAPSTQPIAAGRIDEPIQLKRAAYVPTMSSIPEVSTSEAMAKVRETTPEAHQVDSLNIVAQRVAAEFARNSRPEANLQRQLGGWIKQAGFRSGATLIFTTCNGEKFGERYPGKHLNGSQIGIGCKDMGGIQYWSVVFAR